ncbi:hypothetical protein ACWDA9_10860, partial [Streptomyces sp. NPDC001193]
MHRQQAQSPAPHGHRALHRTRLARRQRQPQHRPPPQGTRRQSEGRHRGYTPDRYESEPYADSSAEQH